MTCGVVVVAAAVVARSAASACTLFFPFHLSTSQFQFNQHSSSTLRSNANRAGFQTVMPHPRQARTQPPMRPPRHPRNRAQTHAILLQTPSSSSVFVDTTLLRLLPGLQWFGRRELRVSRESVPQLHATPPRSPLPSTASNGQLLHRRDPLHPAPSRGPPTLLLGRAVCAPPVRTAGSRLHAASPASQRVVPDPSSLLATAQHSLLDVACSEWPACILFPRSSALSPPAPRGNPAMHLGLLCGRLSCAYHNSLVASWPGPLLFAAAALVNIP